MHSTTFQTRMLFHVCQQCSPMVGIVVTISPSFSLYRMVVLPAASSPTCRANGRGTLNRRLNRATLASSWQTHAKILTIKIRISLRENSCKRGRKAQLSVSCWARDRGLGQGRHQCRSRSACSNRTYPTEQLSECQPHGGSLHFQFSRQMPIRS